MRKKKEQENDLGASAPVRSPASSADAGTEALPNVMPEHRGFSGVCGGLFCKAVLLRLGGEMETVIEFRYPPPPDYREPIRRRFSLNPDPTPGYQPYPCRTFVRDDRLRSPDHQWWLVYNSGASRSPFDAYVYREIGSGNRATNDHSVTPHRSEAPKGALLVDRVRGQSTHDLS